MYSVSGKCPTKIQKMDFLLSKIKVLKNKIVQYEPIISNVFIAQYVGSFSIIFKT